MIVEMGFCPSDGSAVVHPGDYFPARFLRKCNNSENYLWEVNK